jgi:hypothetical protein
MGEDVCEVLVLASVDHFIKITSLKWKICKLKPWAANALD